MKHGGRGEKYFKLDVLLRKSNVGHVSSSSRQIKLMTKKKNNINCYVVFIFTRSFIILEDAQLVELDNVTVDAWL